MVETNNSGNRSFKSGKSKPCPTCGYDESGAGATECEICKTSLLDEVVAARDESRILKNTHNSRLKAKHSKSLKSFTSIIRRNSAKWKNSITKASLEQKKINLTIREISKPLNLIGLFVLFVAITLWINLLFLSNSNQTIQVINKNQNVAEKSVPVPQGLFGYGGAGIFAPIVGSDVNTLIERKYSGYELRYTKPLNGDFSSFQGIRMLLDSEIAFAYNDRPLTDDEYQAAKLRSFDLKQVPIALDAVTVLGNRKIKTERLNRQQLLQIYLGEITNWHQIDSNIVDLPIAPILVENEDIRLLGIDREQKLADSIEYTTNYTQALRKVISEPGGVSFSSVSLVKNQKLVKLFALADSSSSDYVLPIDSNDRLNIADFKSGRYPLTRKIFIVFRDDGTRDYDAATLYSDYLTSEKGQNLIEETGLVPIVNYAKKDKVY